MMSRLVLEAKFIDLRRLSRDAISRDDIARCVIRKLGWRRPYSQKEYRYCRSSTYSLPTDSGFRYISATIKQIKEVSSADVFQCPIRQ